MRAGSGFAAFDHAADDSGAHPVDDTGAVEHIGDQYFAQRDLRRFRRVSDRSLRRPW